MNPCFWKDSILDPNMVWNFLKRAKFEMRLVNNNGIIKNKYVTPLTGGTEADLMFVYYYEICTKSTHFFGPESLLHPRMISGRAALTKYIKSAL